MSDDESFVILGTSPLSSLKQASGFPSNDFSSVGSLPKRQNGRIADEIINPDQEIINKVENVLEQQEEKKSIDNVEGSKEQPVDASLTSKIQKESDDSNNSVTNMFINPIIAQEQIYVDISEKINDSVLTTKNFLVENKTSKNDIYSNIQVDLATAETNKGLQKSTSSINKESLAASFILGDVNADVLKSSVYSQFPSICSIESSAEDVAKLQNFMTEYVELKNALGQVNLTMKQFYEKTQQWKEGMQRVEQSYQQQLQECQKQISILHCDNTNLKRDLCTKIDQVAISEALRQKAHDDLVNLVSEKTALIEDMRKQIAKLQEQQQQLECAPEKITDCRSQLEYVDRCEHDRIVKELKNDLSGLLAKNLDLMDVQKQYIDEINCLKVNVVAAEELIKQNQVEMKMLKSAEVANSKQIQQFKAEREQIKEELILLRQQVDVYSRDFEIERESRQNLAGEKVQLLDDLRTLQRKNKELIEQAQSQYNVMEQQHSLAVSQNELPKNPPNMTMQYCPLCSKGFKDLESLEAHVNECLDKN